MTRLACLVEYLGRDFSGFQRQNFDGLRTVQGELERAISQVANAPTDVTCAGRTDAGVNATGQVIHFETDAHRSLFSWLMGINSNLPNDISVREVVHVDDDFHARFSAVSRRYHYAFYTRKTQSSLLKHRASFAPLEQDKMLDMAAMQAASRCLIGEHDFSSFRASECQAKTANRCIDYLHFYPLAQVTIVDIRANAFLHHMVRNIVGTLWEVGKGKQDVEWVHDVLLAKDRRAAGPTAPSDGLYLTEVTYKSPIFSDAFIAPFPHV